MSYIGTLNYQWAFSLINYFALHGVTQAVISPGSRSTPLALACEKHPDITTWIQIDERSAGFFALGLAQQECKPVILICTSGSAVTHWFPAVVEANHSYTPLLLLSADRPVELQHCGANQTIDQNFLFGSHVRDSISLEHADETLLKNNYLKRITLQAYGKSLNRKPGPVHINIPFREPLLPRRFIAEELNRFIGQLSEQIITTDTLAIQSSTSRLTIAKTTLQLLTQKLETGNGIIICGRLTTQEHKEFAIRLPELAEKLNCPVLLDPLSMQRFAQSPSAHFIYNYDHFLKQHLTHSNNDNNPFTPDWVMRFGQFPVSKNLMRYLQHLECHNILINSFGEWLDPIHKANTLLHTSPAELCKQLLNNPLKANQPSCLNQWQEADRKAEDKIQHTLETLPLLFEGHVISALLKSIPDNSFLFSGNSMAIRDFDTFITRSSASGKNLAFFGNRGVSGIDGNLSTFLGLLANGQQSKKRLSHNKCYGVALLGDLSFYHDMNGLLMCKNLAAMGYNATILLLNNSGGGIFNYLPQAQLDDFDKLWKTDTGLDFQHSAKLYGLDYLRIENTEELESKLPDVFTQSGIQLVEIIIDQKTSVECHKQI
ncbi:MAG: 2-succinyl-5-enolpyruvyl-6-hydroxy-3-cyclohexene-1-carboxylic-acid synthase [Gammaproteobacteria bacterium]|nr:2-succinyl-5-enolpyruvyl-6-hydroxy-3-cyclohexene-1-carboxylic-acid synthase [Gammaproteobacteria bacterium]